MVPTVFDHAPVLGNLALLVQPDDVRGVHREGLPAAGMPGMKPSLSVPR